VAEPPIIPPELRPWRRTYKADEVAELASAGIAVAKAADAYASTLKRTQPMDPLRMEASYALGLARGRLFGTVRALFNYKED
jgi:hypothetical protein